MRILMISHGYPPTLSGVTRVVQKVARAMVARDHAVTVLAASNDTSPYEHTDQGVRVVRTRAVPNPFWEEGPVPLASRSHLETLLEESQPDVIHVHEAGPLALQLLRLKSDLDIPLMATCYYVPRFAARYLNWNGEPLDVVESLVSAYSTWLYNHFDHVVFATQAHRQIFLENGLQAPSSIVSNGIDLETYRPLSGYREDMETRYHLPEGPRILFVGRLMQDKEIDVLIRAMPQVWDRTRGHLLIVGRGDERSDLEALVQDLDLAHCVHFLGYVPREDLPALYRAVDLFAIASICEVQSLPVLEAAASGLPCVAADAVALPELVHDGENGYLVPPGDPEAMARALIDVLTDPDLAVHMGRESLAIAKPHAEIHTFNRYEMLYQELVRSSTAVPA